MNWEKPPGTSVLADSHIALKLEKTDRNFGYGRKTPRSHIGKYRQEFWFWPTDAPHLNWEISPEVLVLAEKRLAFKLGKTARTSGSERTRPRAQTGKYRQTLWFKPKNASHFNWEISLGISALTEKRPAFKLVTTARKFGSGRKTPSI